MRKLHLDPESLAVQSFSTASPGPRAGTVVARSATEYYFPCNDTVETCNYTCNQTCAGGCTGNNSMQTACLDCFTEAAGCTAAGCRTIEATCYPCG